MSLLTRYLTDPHRAALSKRVTPNGIRLEDVIRSGLRYPDSSVGVYAPDFQSYEVFHELFDPILDSFQAPPMAHRDDLACLNPATVISTRIRIARNLAGHAFPAGMSRSERLSVEEKISHACRCLAPDFRGTITPVKDMPQDKYMAAARIYADWPAGRSVFNTHEKQMSIWINEEDHLRVAVVMQGANVSACYQKMGAVMLRMAAQLDFCVDAQRGYLTSCPSNAGSGMRVSYKVDLRLDDSQKARLEQLESTGILQMRGAEGEHSPRTGGIVDVSFRNRFGISDTHMLRNMAVLCANS